MKYLVTLDCCFLTNWDPILHLNQTGALGEREGSWSPQEGRGSERRGLEWQKGISTSPSLMELGSPKMLQTNKQTVSFIMESSAEMRYRINEGSTQDYGAIIRGISFGFEAMENSMGLQTEEATRISSKMFQTKKCFSKDLKRLGRHKRVSRPSKMDSVARKSFLSPGQCLRDDEEWGEKLQLRRTGLREFWDILMNKTPSLK